MPFFPTPSPNATLSNNFASSLPPPPLPRVIETETRPRDGDKPFQDWSSVSRSNKERHHTSCLNCEKRCSVPGENIETRAPTSWSRRGGQNVSKTWARSVTNRWPNRSRPPLPHLFPFVIREEPNFQAGLCPLTYVVHTSRPIVIVASSLLVSFDRLTGFARCFRRPFDDRSKRK